MKSVKPSKEDKKILADITKVENEIEMAQSTLAKTAHQLAYSGIVQHVNGISELRNRLRGLVFKAEERGLINLKSPRRA